MNKGFSAIEAFVNQWGQSKKPIRKVTDEILASGGPDDLTKAYTMASAHLYLLSEFFQSPKAMKQLQEKHGASIPTAGYEELSYWKKNPAFWCYFSVKKEIYQHFWVIVDNLTGEEHILHSDGITSMQGWDDAKDMNFLALMLPSEGCLQALGAIRYNRLPVSDFLFYCSLFKPEEGLRAILSKHYIKFWKLDTIAPLPVVKHKSFTMGFGWQPFTLTEFDGSRLPGEWVSLTLGTQQKFYIQQADRSMDDLPNRDLLESEVPAMAGSIVRDTRTGEMGIVTNTEVAYPFYAAIIRRIYPSVQLPERPSVFISAALRSVTNSMDLPFPWKKFLDLIELKKEEEPTLAEELSQLQHDLEDIYREAQRTGETLDIDAISKAAKIDRELAQRMFGDYDEWINDDYFADQTEEDGEDK